jgi:hypothetical protein
LDGLEGLLPVIQRGSVHVETGEYVVDVSPAGMGHPLSSVELEALPPLSGRIAGIELSSAASAPLVMTDRSGSYPFLAIQRSGSGITAALLGFPLWRWKLDRKYERNAFDAFFADLIQYLVEGERIPSLEIESARSAYRTGERIVLHLITREDTDPSRIKVEIYAGERREEIIATHLFERNADGRALATIESLPSGEYRAVVRSEGEDGKAREASAEFVVLPVSTEFMDISRNMDLLRHICSVSGGLAVERGDVARVMESLDLTTVERARRQAIELRGSLLLLLATILLLTAEWILRKLWGLV